MRKTLSTAFLAALSLAGAAFGQQAAPRRLVSPEVLPDRHITFRLNAPKATEVALRFAEAGQQPLPMTKDDAGVWSITVGPVEPEIYSYSFVVDSAKVVDPLNPTVNIGVSLDGSVVEVPGTPPRFDEVQSVPRGSIDILTYASAVSKTQRGLYVYVPADYYAQPNKRYPVLYLFHGGGGQERDWSFNGRAGVILDNLIAAKKAVPMIIVMPNNVAGTPAANMARDPNAAPIPATGLGGANYPMMKQELLGEIIPFIAHHYRTIENRESRGIAGLSAGGGTTLNVGLASLDTFAWICEFSSGSFGGNGNAEPFDVEKVSPGIYKDIAATNKKIKLFYMSVGTNDPRNPFQKKALADFQSHHLNVTFNEFEGVHEWKVWRHSLADAAQKLFR